MAILIMLRPEQTKLSTRPHKRLGPCVGEHKGGWPAEPEAAVGGHDAAHENRADDAAVQQVGPAWAFDAQTGHERRRPLVFGTRHGQAGVDIDTLTDRRLKPARRAAVLDILASVNDRPRPRLSDGDGALPGVAIRVHGAPL